MVRIEFTPTRALIVLGPLGLVSYNTGPDWWGFTYLWCGLFGYHELSMDHTVSLRRRPNP